ncbi:hypothetical protein [Pseudanabaena sp. ABRG5-3]|uniref:hypothetical protein n=1 Tax=Pseudanabaena sp. ABRG5-3 TaxID=685565 RepID=UPI000DC70864|nr:hypothetical protein [Pseudanabaena sp. ABRG5-3]BBC22561.1 hypothetical protein ABRG53_0304 [Pseudanabaena sp. ABRG5-3]
MIAYIVCEGDFDTQLLKAVLPKDLLQKVEIVSAGGQYAAKSLARSLIVRRQAPVALVLDADLIDPDLIQERCTSIQELLESVSINTPVKVILAVPQIESILFQDRGLLCRLMGLEITSDTVVNARNQPKKALEKLISQSKSYQGQSQIINQLVHEDLEILRKDPVIQELVQFLQSVREPAKV